MSAPATAVSFEFGAARFPKPGRFAVALSEPLRRRATSAGRDSSVFLLVGEHQRITHAHTSAPRAQVDDLVAVVAFDAVD